MSTITAAIMADLIEDVKILMGIEDDDTAIAADAFAIYHDQSASATAATVAVTATAVVLVITGGSNAGTSTLAFADTDKDTLDEMVTAINGLAKGWVATLLGDPDASSSTLIRFDATSAFGAANEQVLQYENEALLELLINGVWAGMETALCRDILSTTFNEEYFRPEEGRLILEQPTVTSVNRLSMETEDGLRVQYTGTDTHATVEVTDTAVVTRSRVGGTTTTTTSLFSANVQTSDMATTINALPGWTATVVNTVPSAYLRRVPVRDAKSIQVTLVAWDDWDGEFEVDYDAGVVDLRHGWVAAWPTLDTGGKLAVEYTAGYATIPADVQLALLTVVADLFRQTTTGTGDATLTSETLGDYSYTRGSSPEEIRQRAIGAGQRAAEQLKKKYMRWLP